MEFKTNPSIRNEQIEQIVSSIPTPGYNTEPPVLNRNEGCIALTFTGVPMCVSLGVGHVYGAATGLMAGGIAWIGLPIAYLLCCTNPCYQGPNHS